MTSVTSRETLLRAALVMMGLLTSLPALALASASVLETTYGVNDPEPMTLALLRHRGMLQLLLGAALIWAAFFTPARKAAAIAAVTGKSTFLLLILPDPALRAELTPFSTVVDLTCIVALTVLVLLQDQLRATWRGLRRTNAR
ncbi:hypothetical protein [Spirillospora sp. CA-294931]|uniref:hypothetical protein n=1 Tax=Spirillospora sp. CA-294931 TaxID=3240042 RepID=UPI003D8B6BD1